MITNSLVKAQIAQLDAERAEKEVGASSRATAPVPTPSAWAFRPADFSDAGAAAAFAEWSVDRLRFCPELGWLRWNGTVWQTGDELAVDEAIAYSSALLADALDNYAAVSRLCEPGSTECKRADAFRTFAVKSRSEGRIKALLDLSRGALRVSIDELDADGLGVNTPGGFVDLRSGKLWPRDPARLCTKITSCAPGANGAELWDRFLDDITLGEPSLKRFLQEVAGMATVGKVLTETAVIFVGAGKNGKSTFLNALASVLGTYAGSMPVDVLTTARQQRGAVFAELRGKRLVQTGELEQGARLSVATLKQLCSVDRIPCERKYCAPGDFQPTHTVVLASNYLPRVGSDDAGTWRRLLIVPFNAKFSGNKERKNFSAELVEKAGPAILSWCIEGAALFLRDGGRLSIPDVVAESTDDYKESEDKIGNFLAACCETDSGASRTQANDLYQSFRAFCEAAGEYCGRQREFHDSMAARGFRQVNVHGAKFWLGVRLVRSGGSPYARQEYA